MLAPLLLLAFFQAASPAYKGTDTGAMLVSECRAAIRLADDRPGEAQADADGVNAFRCIAYLDGFIAGINLLKPSLCVAEASKGTVARVYISYMDRNPKYFDRPPQIGLALALAEVYGCGHSD